MAKSILDIFKNKSAQNKKKDSAKKVAAGVSIGALIGGVAGLLFAPKSGKETRQDIADKTKQAAETVKKTAEKTISTIKTKKEGCCCESTQEAEKKEE